jgi:hypothetical protein
MTYFIQDLIIIFSGTALIYISVISYELYKTKRK